MANLILSFEVVFPLFLCILLGAGLRRAGMIREEMLNDLNRLCFRVFLPVYLYDNISRTELSEAFHGRLVACSFGIVSVIFLLCMLVIPRIERENRNRGVMIQAIFRSNFALFGLPVAISLCGDEGAGPTSLLVGLLVPFYNVLAVITLEFFRGGRPEARKMLRGILTNPLILASLAGILVNLSGITLPAVLTKTVTDVGRVATPLSLVVLGASFVLGSVSLYRRQLVISLTAKLLLFPLAAISLAAALGFRGDLLVPVLVFSGAPTAVSSYTMAQQMEGNGELAADLVVLTTGCCIFTMFLWIFLCKQTGLI